MSSGRYHWRRVEPPPAQGVGQRLLQHPYGLWRWLRPGAARELGMLVERPADTTDEQWQTMLELGPGERLVEPPLYRALSELRIRTARRGSLPVPADEAADLQDMRRRWEPADRPAQPPVLAIVDDTCAFLNRAFRVGDRTRFLALWDQTEDGDSLRRGLRPKEFGYGRELLSDDIEALLGKLAQGVTERAAYRRAGQYQPGDMNWTHGTHVLGLAASAIGGAADAAARARLIAVQIPRSAMARTHGLWLNTYLIDALHYVLLRAPPDAPVVVNVSMSGDTGPHDGRSLLERGIDELIQRQRGRLTVVLAAGNQREARRHQRKRLNAGETLPLDFGNLPDDPTPGFIEIWADSDSDALPDLGLDIAFAQGPVCAVAAGEAFALMRSDIGAVQPDGSALALASLSRAVSSSAPGRRWRWRGLVAVGQTFQRIAGARMAPNGDWSLAVRHRGTGAAIDVDARIVRDDLPENYLDQLAGARSLSYLTPRSVSTASTLSGIATGQLPVVVGAYWLGADGRPAMYPGSGEGEAGRGPHVCGSTGGAGAGGMPGLKYFSHEEPLHPRPRAGTSMAAPYVVRRLAELLAEHPGDAWMSRQELLDALQNRFPNVKPSDAGPLAWTGPLWI